MTSDLLSTGSLGQSDLNDINHERLQRIWRTPSHVDVKHADGKYYVWELGTVVKLAGPEGQRHYTLIDFYTNLGNCICGVFRLGTQINKSRDRMLGDLEVSLATLDPPPPRKMAKAVYNVGRAESASFYQFYSHLIACTGVRYCRPRRSCRSDC